MYDGRQIEQNNNDDDISNNEHVNNDISKTLPDDNLSAKRLEDLKVSNEAIEEKIDEFNNRLQEISSKSDFGLADLLKELEYMHWEHMEVLRDLIAYDVMQAEHHMEKNNEYLKEGIVSINILIVVLIIVIVINNFVGTIFKR